MGVPPPLGIHITVRVDIRIRKESPGINLVLITVALITRPSFREPTYCSLLLLRQQGKYMGSALRQIWAQMPASAGGSWVTLGKALTLSEPLLLNL